MLVDVDLRQPTSTSGDERFKFKWQSSLGGGVILFFPHTKLESDKVLHVDEYRDLSNLDHAIFNALSLTKTQDKRSPKLVVSYGDFCYRIWGVQHDCNYYLYWFDTLTRYDHEGYVKPMVHHVPVLVETDGHLNITSFVCFNALDIIKPDVADATSGYFMKLPALHLPAHKESFTPLGTMMFNCDNLSRTPSTGAVKSLHTVDDFTASTNVRNISPAGICDSDVSIYLEEEEAGKQEEDLINP